MAYTLVKQLIPSLLTLSALASGMNAVKLAFGLKYIYYVVLLYNFFSR
jgi:hypothetical protein